MENSYTNPIYPNDSADPFVLYFNGMFWCYHSGILPDGSVFGILRSADLVHWVLVGGAMQPLPDPQQFLYYWAPEVTYHQGTFYLYYSTGDEVHMQVRVATSSRPEGPFVDSGYRLTHEQFAIDAHVFTDEDGSRWMFYATDFLERERIGTSTVMDRMTGPFTLAGSPSPVSLALYDWQIYDPKRKEKGDVRWHTIEGSFVLKHDGRYYQMFSGGNYHNVSYGVGYAETDDITRREEWRQVADGVLRFPVLRTVPEHVYGPGHNSVVVGPDHRQLFCCYHVIKTYRPLLRILAIDRLEWIGERLVVLGPTYLSQSVPIRAAPMKKFSSDGAWKSEGRQFHGTGRVMFPLSQPSFLFQVYARSAPGDGEAGSFGIGLEGAAGQALGVRYSPQVNELTLIQPGQNPAMLPLPEVFNPRVFHQFLVEVDGPRVSLRLDPPIGSVSACLWSGGVVGPLERLVLYGEGSGAQFSSAEITSGYEECFRYSDRALAEVGWQVQNGHWSIQDGKLTAQGTEQQPGLADRGPAFQDYEWVVNFRLVRGKGLSLFPVLSAQGSGLEIRLEGAESAAMRIDEEPVALPAGIDLAEYQQLRVWKQAGRMRISLQEHLLGDWPVTGEKSWTGLGVDPGAAAEFEMVRLTEII